MSETPESQNPETPETAVSESDPNADSRDGLAGGMGVSSERRGRVRGVDEEATYGAAPYPDEEAGPASGEDVPPEQSASDGRPEVHPDNDVPSHARNPEGNPGHARN